MKKIELVAVYGSLRKKLHNHHLIESSDYLGSFSSEPVYYMYDLKSYPGIVEGGDTSILMEVYKVDSDTMKKLNLLEGYDENNLDKKYNFYNRKEINTPYGRSYFYVYNYEIFDYKKVECGDWHSYKNEETKEINKNYKEWDLC